MVDDADPADPVEAAADELYGGDPGAFTVRRTELSNAAKKSGDAASAKRISALRKPTMSASVVNRLVLADRSASDRLADLSARLHDAQGSLDAAALRELSTERRRVVGELARAAFGAAGHREPTAALRDEVTGTLDAALADPEVAAQLGRLTRAQTWSGFGFATSATPELTLVRGGGGTGRSSGVGRRRSGDDRSPDAAGSTDEARSADAQSPDAAAPTRGPRAGAARPPTSDGSESRAPAAARRRAARAVEQARATFETADRTYGTAQAAEQDLTDRIRTLHGELAELQKELDRAKRELDTHRRDVKSARVRRREARSALDRAERNAPD